ncbi:MAG TPA: hypothetical protein VEH84_04540 [Alphaproteobacteria bacterium]|nr:hypothetical protein [Alphaproteobacteria bacterium]
MSAAPADKAAVLAALRQQVRRIEGAGAAGAGALPLGLPAIDEALPDGGLALARVHEVAGGDGAETAFCAALLGRMAGPVLWLARGHDLYAPGLAAYGLPPERLLVMVPGGDPAILWAMEEALRCRALAAVVGEVGRLPAVAARRLQLAAEAGGTTGLLLRWAGRAAAKSAAERSAVAASRWSVAAAPAQPVGEPGVGLPRWRVALEQCRGGRPGAWLVTWPPAHGPHAAPPLAVPLAEGGAEAPAATQAGRDGLPVPAERRAIPA